MNEFWELVLIVGIMFIVITSAVFTVVAIDVKITLNKTEANIVQVYDGERLVYEGKRAFINIDSGGDTTTVQIYNKLFPFCVVRETISSKNIVVKNK